MASTSITPPAFIVQQFFARRPSGVNRPLLPYVFGPLAKTVRYAKSDEKDIGYLGQYIDSPGVVEGEAQTLYSWPSLPVGGSVDASFTKLYIEKGLARYYQDVTGNAYKAGDNVLHSPDDVYGAKTGKPSTIIDGGVLPGDLVLIEGGGVVLDAFTLATYVVSTDGPDVAAVVDAAVAATTNKAVVAASVTPTVGENNSTNLTFTPTNSTYDGSEIGRTTETYTVTVITAGAGGVAKLSVTSASGTDDVASVTAPVLGASLEIGTRGQLVVFTADQGTTYDEGDTWTVVVQQEVEATTVGVAGTYTSRQDRTYIVEIITGGAIAGSTIKVAVSSQDGTDSMAVQTIAGGEVVLGSYGLTLTFSAATNLIKGDKWTVDVTGITQGHLRRINLADNLPADLDVGDASENLTVSIFRPYNGEIPRQALTEGQFNYTGEATQLRVAAGVTLNIAGITLDDVAIDCPLVSEDAFAGVNKLFVNYRAWYARSTDLFSVTTDTDLDIAFDGVTDSDNPLKYAISLARTGAVGETIYAYNTGDPSLTANWEAALEAGSRSDAVYGYVPLTHDADILALCAASVAASNQSTFNAYRVLWASSAKAQFVTKVDATTTDDDQVALAVVEDNSVATGTQYTQLRLTSGNADLLELGIRAGDEVRFLFSVDAWGNETYVSRIVQEVRSATTLIVTVAFDAEEAVPRRVEIIRELSTSELRDHYGAEAAQWGSDLVRHVIAPTVLIGSNSLPAYFLTPILAGMRAYYWPHQPLSTLAIPSVLGIEGLEAFTSSDLNRMAGSGAFICNYDFRTQAVRIRHAITTGDNAILAKLEESMVSARHAALFQINSRLSIYAGQVNISDGDGIDVLAEQIRSEMESLNKSLQSQGNTPELGGLIRSLVISSIAPSVTVGDELVIDGELELGRPGNKIRFNVLIR